MRNVHALILCAGEGEGWNNYLGIPKQLIEINGETLLARTARLLKECGVGRVTIVTADERLAIKGCAVFEPIERRWVAETLLSTRPLWDDCTVAFLGDVCYSPQAISQALAAPENVRVHGKLGRHPESSSGWGEIFVVSFRKRAAERIVDAARAAIRHAEKGGRGKLCQLYRALNGIPLDEHRVEGEIFHRIDDYTDDFDTPRDYERTIRVYEEVLKPPVWKRWASAINARFAPCRD
ncbi:MAG: NTP transferase domain-containing protein [Kiritimatiellia bacterium]|jgi:hypothetical protein|nr:NTP transferase domain-containing protein [Kiritimatiellia bacterium]MDP6847491.1 NTP transferase domain-containing protein [Kiritimatiellia bacterium]